MSSPRPADAFTVTQSAVIVAGPCVYMGGMLRANANGAATVTVRDGEDTSSPERDYFYASASLAVTEELNPGVYFSRGLFVDLGSNIGAFVAYYNTIDPNAPPDQD